MISEGIRGITLMLDSCFSGSFLIDVLVILENENIDIQLYNCLISSLHNESSWEMEFLEHGVLTYTYLNPGNKNISSNEFSLAIEKNDHKIIAKCMQGLVGMMGRPVSFLTQGRQHSISCFKGVCFSVDKYGGFNLPDYGDTVITRDYLKEMFIQAKNSIWDKEKI